MRHGLCVKVTPIKPGDGCESDRHVALDKNEN
jgi:hypothetical protein